MGTGQRAAADAVEHGIPVVQLRVSGTFDAPALPQIEHAVEEVLAVKPRVLMVDLSDCSHIDAAGVAVLLDAHRRMRRDRGWLTVHAPNREVQRLLRIARVDGVLDIRTHGEPFGAALHPAAASRSARRAAVPITTVRNQGGLL